MISELERVSSLLEGKSTDAIGFFDESRKRWHLHNLDLRFKKKTFHRIGFENADNEDCNLVDNRKGSEYLGAREDEETES